MSLWLVDVVLIAGLLALAWRIVTGQGLFRTVVMFLAFGLVMALAWLRLGAIDVAFAEAGVGVGVTGALLLLAHRDLALRDGLEEAPVPLAWRAPLAVAAAVVTGLVAFAVVHAASGARPLVQAVAGNLGASGVGNPVTAVLLNFRAYDTLLELAVILAAVVATGALRPGFPVRPSTNASDPGLTALLVRTVVPPAVVTGGYLFWAGAHAPGGAFQAGAVLAAAMVLLALERRLAPHGHATSPQRVLLAAGLAAFLAVGLGVMAETGGFLHYPRPLAGTLIALVEAAVTVSVALALAVLCLGAAGIGTRRQP